MSYAIRNFKCTPLGKERLENKKPSTDLTSSEKSVVRLIYEYHAEGLTDDKQKIIEGEFKSLYYEVNLTRLVVTRILKFEHTYHGSSNRKKEIERKIDKSEAKIHTSENIEIDLFNDNETIKPSNSIEPILTIVSGNF